MKTEMLSEVKSELVELMKRREKITVKDAAERLDLAVSTVRQHLLGLENDGFIRSADLRQGVGRPQKVYFLTEKGDELFPSREREVLPKLLEFLAETEQASAVEKFFSTFCEEDTRSWKYEIRGKTGEERLNSLVSFLARAGYSPELSGGGKGHHSLELHHCPYGSIVSVTQAPCDCKQEAIAELLGTKVHRKSSIAWGDSSCRFALDWSR